jgi:hypothetical protein
MSDRKHAFHALVEKAEVDRLDDWRRLQPTIPPRSEALRELIRRALHAEDRQHGKERPA